MTLSNNKILITGGATGIGLGLCQRFIEENNTVIVCGRRESALAAAKQAFPSIITKVCDVSIEAERIALFEWIHTEHPDLNVLVNNAGIQQWMSIEDPMFYSKTVVEMNTNMQAPVHLTSLFLQLKSLKTIMNVTSGLAFIQLAKVPVYCATKAFFHSFTKSLRQQLLPKNIEVIEIIPPALNTDLGGKGLHDEHPPVSAFIEAIFEQLKAGKIELTFGFSEVMSKATPDQIQATFERMNG